MRDPHQWMWAQACDFLARADRLQRQFFQLGAGLPRRPSWEPPVDVFETEHELLVLVALPGVPPQDVEVLVDGPTLTVVGRRCLSMVDECAAIRRLEIPHGRFERRITLSSQWPKLRRRQHEAGILLLAFRKLENDFP